MCCERCRCEIAPGTARTIWDGATRWVRVCTLCVPFVASIIFGQTSPALEPAPVLRYTRSVAVDSGASATDPIDWRSEGWSGVAFYAGKFVETCDAETLGSLFTVSCPSPLRDENTPELPHPPHGEGSGELPIFVGIGASGAMSNVVNTAMASSSWEPPDQNHSATGGFFLETDPHAKHMPLKVGSVGAQRPMMPRIRRSC